MRIARSTSKTLAATFGFALLALAVQPASAAPAAPAGYAIQFDRPVKVGDAYRITSSGSLTKSTVVKANGKEVNRVGGDARFALVGDVQVLEVSPKGEPTRERLTVATLEQTKDGKKTELLPPGTVVTAGREGGAPVYTTPAGPVAAEAKEALTVLFSVTDPQTPGEQAAFGTAGRKRVGESWDAKADAIAAALAKSGMPVDPATAKGQATLVEVKPVGGVECATVRYTSSGKVAAGAPVPNAPAWAKVQSGGMDITSTKVMPTNPALPEVADGSEMTMTMVAGGNAPQGGVVTMEVSVRGSRQATYERKK